MLHVSLSLSLYFLVPIKFIWLELEASQSTRVHFCHSNQFDLATRLSTAHGAYSPILPSKGPAKWRRASKRINYRVGESWRSKLNCYFDILASFASVSQSVSQSVTSSRVCWPAKGRPFERKELVTEIQESAREGQSFLSTTSWSLSWCSYRFLRQCSWREF